jgi:hypothetical protein
MAEIHAFDAGLRLASKRSRRRENPMLGLASAITTLSSILVSDDRLPDFDPAAARAAATGAKAKAEAGVQAVYNRGQSEFAQTLEKVDAQPLILQALEEVHKLAAPDTSVDTLVQASAQDGGERMRQASRLGINLDAKS